MRLLVAIGMLIGLSTAGCTPAGGAPRSTPPRSPSGAVNAVAPMATTVAAPPPFTSSVTALDARLRARVRGRSWRPGCPVALADLRLVRVRHWGADRRTHTGALVVHRTLGRDVVRVFATLYRDRYPVRRMRLVDDYGADDDRSMAANNTSAFNCRRATGSRTRWSEHAYGRAIDLNPLWNPYVTRSGRISPPAGRPYADRSRRDRGVIHHGDATTRAFARVGWKWGGDWRSPKDYQHFSSTGR